VIPDELKAALESNQEANKLFKVLTLGKKREFAEYIAEAKREDTKQKRIEKIIPMMLNGIGLNDKYKK
ncbi:MAG: YdeI/OmpD-associated family protein, partial [Bacteroidota bacterium]